MKTEYIMSSNPPRSDLRIDTCNIDQRCKRTFKSTYNEFKHGFTTDVLDVESTLDEITLVTSNYQGALSAVTFQD